MVVYGRWSLTKRWSHMEVRLNTSVTHENQSFWFKVILIQVISIQTQAVKLHKNFVHFKYSLQVNKKSILGEYLHSLSQVCGTIYTSWMNKLVSKRLVSKQLCIEMTGNLSPPPLPSSCCSHNYSLFIFCYQCFYPGGISWCSCITVTSAAWT